MSRADMARRIREAREQRGITQTEAAQRLGVPPSRIWEWETGARTPLAITIVEIIEKLELDPRIIFPEFWASKKP